MVDARDFFDLQHLDPDLAARAERLALADGPVPREEKRGTARKRPGRFRLGPRDRQGHEAWVCENGEWASLLISDQPPPLGRWIDIEWDGADGRPRRVHGRVRELRQGVRAGERTPDLYYARFETQ